MRYQIVFVTYYILYIGVANYIKDCSDKTTTIKTEWELRNRDGTLTNTTESELATNEKRNRNGTPTNTNLPNFSILQTEQQEIGWDNLLRGKISKRWKEIQKWHELTNQFQRKQRNVRLRTNSGGCIRNPYDDDKEKKEKKQKKEKDIFQILIEKFFVICEEELWRQRNLD